MVSVPLSYRGNLGGVGFCYYLLDDMLQLLTVICLVEIVSTQKWCPESTFFSNSSGDLSSPKPRGSLLYPDYTRCVWHISIPASNQHIKLTFNTFQLESCLDCQCDFVEILDVIGNIHTSLGKFCGSSLPGPFFSSKQALKVVFSSDHGNGFSGFTATYSSVLPGAVCRNATSLVTSVGTVHSPEFPSRNYPNNVDCIWEITAPYRTRIIFKFLSMSIQSCGRMGTSEFCSCDYVEVRDGANSSARLLGTFCGTNNTDAIYSSGQHLWVRFRSDDAVADSGFVAQFSSEKYRKGFSCPMDWRYPFQCPKELNVNNNKTGICCYNNGPSCCEPGGKRCHDNGSRVRDYCPRPKDNKKLKYCCSIGGKPSCCESAGVYNEARYTISLGVILHIGWILNKWFNGT